MHIYGNKTILTTLAAALLLAPAAHGLSPAEKCEASKLGTAGKYDFCRLKAEAKAVKIGGSPDFSKCDPKFSDKWTNAESGGSCPSNGDDATVQAFITEHTDALQAAIEGTPLPEGVLSCNADLAACNGNLGTCNTNDASCNTDLTTCNNNLTGCNGLYNFCLIGLNACEGGTAAPANVLSGKTFSSNFGLGLSGTMANNGAVHLTPETASQVIPAGYHNGLGTVAGDANLLSGNIKAGVSLFGVPGSLATGVPKTGQTMSYGAGSDGDLQRGASRTFIDNGDGTISDTLTGLMWEKKSSDGSIHDKNKTYSWGLTSSPYTMNGTMTTMFLAAMNSSGGFAGHTDWRIPNVSELQTIMNYENVSPSVDPIFNTNCVSSCTVLTCSCTEPAFYWSSTTYQITPDLAMFIFFADGYTYGDLKSNPNSVRAVRGGA